VKLGFREAAHPYAAKQERTSATAQASAARRFGERVRRKGMSGCYRPPEREGQAAAGGTRFRYARGALELATGRARMRVFGRAVGVALVAVALAAGGCGGDDDGGDEKESGQAPAPTTAPTEAAPAGGSDEEGVRTTMTTYTKAVAAGDGKTACEQLTENARGIAARAQGAKADTCEGVISEVAKLLREADRAKLRSIGPNDVEVEIDGDSATADIKGSKTTAKLVRRDDRWLIDQYNAGGPRAQQGEDEEERPSPRSVAWNRVEDELDEVMERRYERASYRCPPRTVIRVGEEVDCMLEADGKRGTMKVSFMEDSFLGYEIRLGGRISYGRSQITP
jgi:hypothetical protein